VADQEEGVNAPSVSDRPVRESLPAGRNVVVCLDGTSNKYDATNTNVVKLYAMLDKYDVDQLCYYQTGIGTFAPPGVWGKFKRWFFTRLDLAIAWLLEEHVTSAYRFLMRYYEQGDRIYIFGFSRGAYSARVLAAMLHKVGLLSRGNEELIPFAWDLFSRERDIELATGFRDTFGRKVGVRFLGLWDTVSSVGWAWSPKHFQFTANNPSVQTIRHAVSLDERRTYFVQNLWTPESVPGQDCLQVWFPGVHCDVGGGYPEADGGLSKIALSWMVREAQVAGVRFHPATKERVLGDQQGDYVRATQHESLSGLWWLPEWIPKRVKDPAAQYNDRWIVPRGRHRYVAEGALIHASVFERMTRLPQQYRPPNLPQPHREVR
jgi:uncharacterized protein (DUF2235 family)